MNSPFKFKFLLVFLVLLSSCGIDELDFDQANNYSAVRVFKASLVYFTASQGDFLDATGAEITVPIGDNAGFLFFINNPSLRSNLEKLEIEVEINNQFNREFKGKIQFFDENGVLTQEFDDLNIASKQTNYKNTFTLLIADNVSFLNSTEVRLQVELQPSTDGSVLNPANQETLNFKSTGVYYIKGGTK